MACSSKFILYIYIFHKAEFITYQTVYVTFIFLQKCLHSAGYGAKCLWRYSISEFHRYMCPVFFFYYHASWEMRERPVSCGKEVMWYIHFLYSDVPLSQFMAPLHISSPPSDVVKYSAPRRRHGQIPSTRMSERAADKTHNWTWWHKFYWIQCCIYQDCKTGGCSETKTEMKHSPSQEKTTCLVFFQFFNESCTTWQQLKYIIVKVFSDRRWPATIFNVNMEAAVRSCVSFSGCKPTFEDVTLDYDQL